MPQENQAQAPLLEVRELKKYYPTQTGLFARNREEQLLKAVDGVSFALRPGETLGLVGESGCGKSTIGRQIVGLETPTSGNIWYRGEGWPEAKELGTLTREEQRQARTDLQMVFQDPYSSLNPRKRVYDILAEPMAFHNILPRQELGREVERLLEQVGLPRSAKDRFPHEFSGGQRQRIGIARALAVRPRFLVCDEPVSALDVSIQAQILNLLRQLQEELGLAFLFIGHGLGAVKYASHRIAVMYLGQIVEMAPSEELFAHPRHPYTVALRDAAPISDPAQRGRERLVLSGDVPSPINPPQGCRFAGRCPFAEERCRQQPQSLIWDGEDPWTAHGCACWKAGQITETKNTPAE